MRKYLILGLLCLPVAAALGITLQKISEESNTAAVLNSVATFPCVTLSRNLSQGIRDTSSNTDVKKLQEFFISKGYTYLEATGYFGVNTRRAVVDWQFKNGVSATGFVGPLTRAAIQKVTCGSSQTKVSAIVVVPETPAQAISVGAPSAGALFKEGDTLKVSWAPVTGDFSNYRVDLKNKLTGTVAANLATTRTVSTELTLSPTFTIPFLISARDVKESAVRASFYVEVAAERPAIIGKRNYIAIGKSGVFTISSSVTSEEPAGPVVTNNKIQEKLVNLTFARQSTKVTGANVISELDLTLDGQVTPADVSLIASFPKVATSSYETIKTKILKAITDRQFTKIGDIQYVAEFDLNNDGAILDGDSALAQTFLNQPQENL